MTAIKQDRPDSQSAFQDVFEAMADWQEETRSVAQRHGEDVLTKLSAAAKSSGWPDAMVDASRNQIQLATKARAGFGIAIVPASLEGLHTDGLSYRPIGGSPQITAPINIVYRRGEASATVRRFIELVRRTAKSIGKNQANAPRVQAANRAEVGLPVHS